MSLIKPLKRRDYRAAYNLSKRVEPYPEHNCYDVFCNTLDTRRGFTIWNEDEVVGVLSYSNFMPGIMAMIHFMIDDENPGGLTKDVVHTAFRFPFINLYLHRLVSYSVVGITDKAGSFLKRLGFRQEGLCKEAAILPDCTRDVEIYGMLKAECRWL